MIRKSVLYKLLFFSLFFHSALILKSQDTLVLFSGAKVLIKSYKLHKNGMVEAEVFKGNKTKVKEFYPVEVFEIKNSDGTNLVLFKEFKIDGKTYNYTNAKEYIQGEIFAKENYRFIFGKILSFMAGFVSPVLSAYFLNSIIFAPVLPLLTTAAIGFFTNEGKIFDRKFKDNNHGEFFKSGYGSMVKSVRLSGATKYSMIGLVSGVVTYIIISKIK